MAEEVAFVQFKYNKTSRQQSPFLQKEPEKQNGNSFSVKCHERLSFPKELTVIENLE